jgi:hypothetical protein
MWVVTSSRRLNKELIRTTPLAGSQATNAISPNLAILPGLATFFSFCP